MSPIYTPGKLTLRKDAPAAWAQGGDLEYTINVSGTTYMVHEFRTVGASALSVLKGTAVQCLIVAGGGSGGRGRTAVAWGAGGGAGGFLEGSMTLAVGVFPVVVGAGGIMPVSGEGRGISGSNSSFNGAVALGGGGGAGYVENALSGGSGGGATGLGGGTNGGSATQGNSGELIGYGNAGGNRGANSAFSCGGGGAGGAGGSNTTTAAGAGGIGRASLITGTSITYAAGGTIAAGNGQNNTGNGGNGIVDAGTGNGGSGIVIVRYAI